MYEGIQPGAMDYSAVVQKLRQEGADLLIFSAATILKRRSLLLMNKKKIRFCSSVRTASRARAPLKIAGKDASGVTPLVRRTSQAAAEHQGA